MKFKAAEQVIEQGHTYYKPDGTLVTENGTMRLTGDDERKERMMKDTDKVERTVLQEKIIVIDTVIQILMALFSDRNGDAVEEIRKTVQNNDTETAWFVLAAMLTMPIDEVYERCQKGE